MRWESSDYVVADSLSRYVVDGHSTSAAARANDGFTKTNLFLRYNRTQKRMEIILAGPMGPGIYEGLVNYDIPGQLPNYWTEDRRERLSLHDRQECEDYYRPQIAGQRPLTARKIMENKSKARKTLLEPLPAIPAQPRGNQKKRKATAKIEPLPTRTIIQMLHVANRTTFKSPGTDNRHAIPPINTTDPTT